MGEDEPRTAPPTAHAATPHRRGRRRGPLRRRIRVLGLSFGGSSQHRGSRSAAKTLATSADACWRRTRCTSSLESGAMKIAVCIKQVPEGGTKRIDPERCASTARVKPASTRSTRTRSRRLCAFAMRPVRERSCSSRWARSGRRRPCARGSRWAPTAPCSSPTSPRRDRPRRHERRPREGARARRRRSRAVRPAIIGLRRRGALCRCRRAAATCRSCLRCRGSRSRTARSTQSGRRSSATTTSPRRCRRSSPSRRDQRASLPVAEGDHGREVEAAGEPHGLRAGARRGDVGEGGSRTEVRALGDPPPRGER